MKLLIIAFLLSSCATKLSLTASKVKLIKNDPPKTCHEIDSVQDSENAKYENTCDYKSLRNALRNKAALIGGNLVRLDSLNAGKNICSIYGTVFKCKNN